MSILNSFKGIFSCWIKIDTMVDLHGLFHALAHVPPFGDNRSVMEIYLAGNLSAPQINIVGSWANGVNDGVAFGLGNLPGSLLPNTWHNILASWDGELTPPNDMKLYIDNVNQTLHGDSFGTEPIDWQYADRISVLKFYNSDAQLLPFMGCIANFYLNTQEYLNLDLPESRAKFISPELEYIFLGNTGELPTGTPPNFYFFGNAEEFAVNRGNFSDLNLVGTFINCSDGPLTLAGI